MSVLRKSTWIAWAENIILVLIISFAFYTTLPIQTTRTLLVPQGSITHIISQLTQKGYALSPIDTYILVFLGKPQSGWVDIGATRLNRIDFLYRLTTAKAKMEEITLIPGETTELFFTSVAADLNLDKTKLDAYYQEFSHYPEAGIYADTYYVPYGISEKHFIHFLLSASEKKYKEISEKIYGTYNKKQWLNVLIVASIIQKEAANTEEMPVVSSVIYNRLKKGMPLQMDGTLNYGKYSHVKVTPERIKNDTSRFNTYKYKGLPHMPIGAVSFNAIIAAIKPAKTDYLYFMKNDKGVHDFTHSYKTHRKNIQKAR
ncbi:endolytic transglycosylase MltG [Sulfurovum sp. TSL1]|uniref:endolytic transglycosylase MltG n=1 Tax=Sulfurovum sp. TSL1 TaxID=2826994 RepID=UPI001CC39789|nr:endolytic transglycosylase MltG [Sulfurovum sp. TSL1]GIT98182.1 aminodeoxychorismate lyase [Sulfurovum sp. TSL1]